MGEKAYPVLNTKNKKHSFALKIIKELLLLTLGAVLFSLSFPSYISKWGFFPLAFFALIPVFIVVHKSRWTSIFLYGIFFGFVSYALFNFWLAKFHPLTLLIVPPIYSFYFLLVFPMLKAADSAFPKNGYILQSLIWVAYEYLRTKGFLGYSYGNMGYSQYLFTPLIQITDLTGVWGISLLVVFPSAYLGHVLQEGFKEGLKKRIKENAVPGFMFAVIFIGVLVYGFIDRADYSGSHYWKTALIQQNVDPWKGGTKPYETSLNILLRLSREAVLKNPDIVIWSETSFVPGIDWHTRYRTDIDKYLLVKRLVDFLKKQKQPFVIGNDDGQLEKNENGKEVRVDYNATVLYEKGKIVETYRKLHLVPFTEYFPFKKTLPRIYDWLVNADTHFWKKGTKYTVFNADGVKFSTPICFEDTFGNLCRNFVKRGADIIVNMTNDSWSYSVAAEMQHMNMAVFRAVENKRTVVRSTNGGITCSIDPNGKILHFLKPFTESYLISSVPVYNGRETLYTRWGDWFAILIVILASCGVVLSLSRLFRKKN
ncbi:MAG: apolipoprotein N-acyltransferase [Spirochaetales bacterium]|nr:apolipoprotein N-acyltransferase [Spirochaetales bacterium]